MTSKINKTELYTILFLIFFLITTLIGSLRLGDVPVKFDFIYTSIIILPLIYYSKKLKKSDLWQVLVFLPFIIYFFLQKTFLGISSENIKEIIFFLFILYAIFTYMFLTIIIEKVNPALIRKIINVFLIFSLILLFIQLFNLFYLNDLLKPYYDFLTANNYGSLDRTRSLAKRPFGTIGNPTKFAFIFYLLCMLSIRLGSSSRLYKTIAFLGLAISGGRMMIIFFFLGELFFKLTKQLSVKFVLNLIKTLFILFLILVICYFSFPYLQYNIDLIISGDMFEKARSITHRKEMYINLLKSGSSIILFGGVPYDKFPSAVDSEYVMRIMQYGLIGFFFIYLPYFFFAVKHNKDVFAGLLIFCCLFNSITAFTVTNFISLSFIILFMVVINKLNRKTEIY